MVRSLVLLLTVIATTASAQIRGSQSPYSVGLSFGLFELGSVVDGSTGNGWNFGYTSQLAATFDKTIRRGLTVGGIAGFATPNLTYRSGAGTRTAKADVTELAATVRLGSGLYGLRSEFVLKGGALHLSNFRDRETSAALPGNAWDPAFGTGYALGLNVGPLTEAYFESNYLFVLHAQGEQVQGSPPRMFTIKVGVRQGF